MVEIWLKMKRWKIDPVIGRDEEIRRIEILSRKTKTIQY